MLVDTEQITGYRHCVSGCHMDQGIDCWIRRTNLTVNYKDRTVVKSDWFYYCINSLLYKFIKSILVDGNHYLKCKIKLLSKIFCLFLLQL